MKKENKKQMKGNKGITLIALVVTIVVLLILAGITISTLFGDNGIISAARKAAEDTKQDETNTEQGLQNLEDQMYDKINNSENSVVDINTLISSNSFITKQQGNQIAKDKTNKTMIVPVGFKVTNDANEIDKGVVIEDKEHNQYVWVPVSDSEFNEMFGSTGSGDNINYFGKLYDFTTTGKGNAMQSAIGSNSGYREPDITDHDGNNASYYANLFTAAIGNITAEDFKGEIQAKFNDMAKSVQKYKGFYIGRYEVSSLSSSNPTTTIPKVVKGVNPSNDVNWYNMYREMQNIETYANSEVQSDVVTNMIWGCQFDRTLDWIANTDSNIGYTGLNNSTTWGNYNDSETFTYRKTDNTEGTKTKNTSTLIPTGSTERNRANNIYDLAGNLSEWTMEAHTYPLVRTARGGYYGHSGSYGEAQAYSRDYYFFYGDTSSGSNNNLGSRPTLYVKVP